MKNVYDLVVVGSGIGGLAAAIAGHDAGLRVLVLEKSTQVGGVTAYSNGQLWVAGNHLQADAGIADSPRAGGNDLARLGMGLTQEELLARLAGERRVRAEPRRSCQCPQWPGRDRVHANRRAALVVESPGR